VKASGRIAECCSVRPMLGRVINPPGSPPHGKGEIATSETRLIDIDAPRHHSAQVGAMSPMQDVAHGGIDAMIRSAVGSGS